MIREIDLSVSLDAPPERIYDAFVDAGRLALWFFPESFEVIEGYIEDRQGGRFFMRAKTGSGEIVELKGEVLEAQRPGRLIFTWQWSARDFDPDITRVDVTIRGDGPDSIIQIKHGPFSEKAFSAHKSGWQRAMGRILELDREAKL